MRALPARRIALGACCAALLVGITGPAATAADPARERTRVVSSDALLVQVRSLDAREGELAPVADLLRAVLEADGGRLSPAEAERLGGAARAALEEAAAKAPATTAGPATTDPAATPEDADPATAATPEESDPATEAATATEEPEAAQDTPLTDDGTELTDDLLDAVREAVDHLLETFPSDAGAGAVQAPASVESRLAEVAALLDALLGADPQASTLPAPAAPAPATQVPLLPGVTLPLLTPLTSVPQPAP
ncbi:hypothetical protein GCM10019016_052790 [Streptomyces prasinosporus]|uniref:Secreted protein n=1 Tax=Streptomyces prasinosporus TaxID=68256 RepID=A0ABP6TVM2_9ACTN